MPSPSFSRMAALLLILGPTAWGSGVLNWDLTGGTAFCNPSNPDPGPPPCLSRHVFGWQGWETPSIILQDGSLLVSTDDTNESPLHISFNTSDIIGYFGALPDSYMVFDFTLLDTPPSDYNFAPVPVLATIRFGGQTGEITYTGMSGTLSSSVSAAI